MILCKRGGAIHLCGWLELIVLLVGVRTPVCEVHTHSRSNNGRAISCILHCIAGTSNSLGLGLVFKFFFLLGGLLSTPAQYTKEYSSWNDQLYCIYSEIRLILK